MFTNVKKALKDYHTIAVSAKAALDHAFAEVKANYTGAMFAEKTAAIKSVYEDTIANARNEMMNRCVAEMAMLQEKAKNVVAAVPGDSIMNLIDTVNGIRVLEAEEAQEYITVCRSNYSASIALHDVLISKGFEDYTVVRYSEILEGFSFCNNMLQRFFNSYDPASYNTNLMLAEVNHPFDSFGEVLQDFINR